MAEIRWILLALGSALLLGIWWWGSRRSAQAPGNAELRETSARKEPHMSEPARAAPPVDREWGTPPLEPLSIHTADFDDIPVMDEPIMVDIEAAPVGPPILTKVARARASVTSPGAAPPPTAPPVSRQPTGAIPTLAETGDRIATAIPQVPNSSERQKIVSVRVCANGRLWSGSQLLAALELHGLVYGKYQVFHRRHADGRSLFCVASLKEPGTFDVAQMANQEFKGITLFAVLPGPLQPLPTVDGLIAAARELAAALAGAIQDADGLPLSPQRAATLRDEVARFQASLPVS